MRIALRKWRGLEAALLAALWLWLAAGARAQIARLEPEQPRWGATLAISYDTSAPGAKFTSADEVYVSAQLLFPGYERHVAARMTKAGKLFKHELQISENLASVAVHFVTMGGGWDEQAYTRTMVYRADGQPARGAYESRIRSARYQEFFQQETALYPDNYSAYRAKWAAVAVVESAKLKATVNADLKKLSRNAENAELLSVLAHGCLLIGNEARSRELIRRLFEKYPDSLFTVRAINDYEEQASNWAIDDAARREVAGMKLAIMQTYPDTAFARQEVGALAHNERAPLALIEKITVQWMKAEPENPQPYLDFALACRHQYRQYEQATPLIEKAIELLLAGKLRLYGDVSGQRTAALLPTAYLISAELAFRQNQPQRALAALKVAQALGTQPAYAAHLLEARVWQKLNEHARAEAAFIQAWRNGSQEAEELLKARYQKQHGGLQGFDEYLLSRTQGDNGRSEWRRPAPNFKVAALNGKTFELTALQGRLVVINLWFVGCGPCRREIPQLNALANEFKDKPVVFLAPSFDSVETLKSFLRGTPFDYHIIANANELIVGGFNATVFPTHIVIDQNGLVAAVLAGAAERRPEEVRRWILQLLNAPAH